MRRIALLFALSTLLSACSANLEQLKQMAPEPNDFHTALASEYLAYSQSEKEQGRGGDAEHFAGKGLAAAKGKNVEPEEVRGFLPESDRNTLNTSRTALLAALTEDAKEASPKKAAHAQLLFDCWQHQMELRINQEIAPCGDEFASVLPELQAVAAEFSTAIDGSKTTAIAFGDRSTVLSDKERSKLESIARQAKTTPGYAITINGNTAALSDKPITRALVKKRITAIRAALVGSGVDDDRVKVLTARPKDHAQPVVLSVETPRPLRSIDVTLILPLRK